MVTPTTKQRLTQSNDVHVKAEGTSETGDKQSFMFVGWLFLTSSPQQISHLLHLLLPAAPLV